MSAPPVVFIVSSFKLPEKRENKVPTDLYNTLYYRFINNLSISYLSTYVNDINTFYAFSQHCKAKKDIRGCLFVITLR